MLRWLLVLSGAAGLAPVSEKRATTGTGWPLKAEAVDSARPWAEPTNSPVAQIPLAPERRWPGNLPVVASSWFTRAVGSVLSAGPADGFWAQPAIRARAAAALAPASRRV